MEAFDLHQVPESLKSHALIVEDCNKLEKADFVNYIFSCAETLAFLTHFDDLLIQSTVCNEEDLTAKPTLRFSIPQTYDKTKSDQPWRDQLRLLQRQQTNDEDTQTPPIDGLSLDWIYGRNVGAPVKYCSNGDVVYAAGSTVVKVTETNDGEAKQEYFMSHSGLVTSIDTFKTNDGVDIVASADVGRDSKICIWSLATLSSIVTISPSLHQSDGISQLSFSLSGELLLSMGNDKDNTLAIYKWRDGRMIFSSKLPKLDVYDCSFLLSDNSFGVCTNEDVYFYTKLEVTNNHPSYNKQRGVFNRLSTREVMTSIACAGDTVITGSLSGRIWLWEGRVCLKLIASLQSGPITQLHSPQSSDCLCASTHGGTVHLFNDKFELMNKLSPNKGLGESARMIDTICWSSELETVLIGQNSSLYQMSNEDETLSCVAYNQHRDQIAIGYGSLDGTSRSSTDKSFVVLNGSDLETVHQGSNSLEALTVCSYSNEGKLLAFGSADACIYLHDTASFSLLAKLRDGHSSPIISIDFGYNDDGEESNTASYLRSNSNGGEVIHWTTQGKLKTPLSLRDTVWESDTCIYTSNLECVHNMYDESGGNITACSTISCSSSILVGDSNGNVRAFSHPPTTTNQPLYLEYKGHAGTIDSIQVLKDSTLVYTMSKYDSCLFQWRKDTLTWEQGLPTTTPLIDRAQPALSEPDMDTMIDQMDTLDFGSNKKVADTKKPPRPWTRSICAPSNYIQSSGPLPSSRLSLERIHGYGGSGVRNNLQSLMTGTSNTTTCLVYTAGRTLIRFDISNDHQDFYNIADGEIMCLSSIHKETSICAIGTSTSVIILDLTTMKPLSLLDGHSNGVSCLDIDDSGKFVVSVSSGKRPEIVVQEWKSRSIIARSLTYGLETLDVQFLKGSSTSIIECGTCFVRFWNIKGGSLRFEEIPLDSLQHHTESYTCICRVGGGDNILVGASTGHIIELDSINKTVCKRLKAHTSAITNISPRSDDGFISSSNDRVKLYSSSMRCMISISTETLDTTHSISSICWAGDSMMVGTTGNEVYQLSSSDGSNMIGDNKALISSHSSSPMGLSVHPNGTFATTSDDGFLRLWNHFDSRENISIDIKMASRACAFSPNAHGKMIAIGCGKPIKDNAKTINGRWIILNISEDGSGQIIAERRDSRAYINEVKWHSNGDIIAVGSGDKKLCVYQLTTQTKPAVNNISLLSIIDLSSVPINFDFSQDGKYLRTSTESNELLFHEAGPGLLIKEPSKLKDCQWETQTCIFGWNVQGVRRENEPDVQSLDCSAQDSSMVSGDSLGRIKMHQYPCTTSAAQFITYPAHLGPVANTRFLPGGYVVSSGVVDNTIMIWRQDIDDRGDFVTSSSSFDPNENKVCNSVIYDESGDKVIYTSSGNCIIFDKQTNQVVDKFPHETTVSAICSSHSRQLIASGDTSAMKIWDAQTCKQVAILSDDRCQKQNISILSFSPDDKKLVSVGTFGCDQTICIWTTQSGDWNDAHLIHYTLAGHDKIHFAVFDTNKSLLVTGGNQHVNFWSEQSGISTLDVSRGDLSQNCTSGTFNCGISLDNKLITGTSCGSFVIWEDKKIVQEVQSHSGSIVTLCKSPEGFISSCSKGIIILWSSANIQKIASFNIASSQSPSKVQLSIYSIDMFPNTSNSSTMKILARMESTDVLEIPTVTGCISLLVKGSGNKAEVPTVENRTMIVEKK